MPIAPNEYYHVYNRGVEKRRIFLDKKDRERFLRLLYLANGEKPYVLRLVQGLPLNEIDVGKRQAAIGAYVLMPNHFHILFKETREGGISAFMEKLQTGYAMYFNKKYERVGALFQGTFKAQHVSRDEHLEYLFAYIHLNPVKIVEPKWKEQGVKNPEDVQRYLESYRYSSYPEYVETPREESVILTKDAFPEYFSERHDFKDFLDDWFSYSSEHTENS